MQRRSTWNAVVLLQVIAKGFTANAPVLRIGPFRFFFYSAEGTEPSHIHIERDDQVAKFWLQPVALESNRGFSRKDLNTLQSLVEENLVILLGAWNDYFNH